MSGTMSPRQELRDGFCCSEQGLTEEGGPACAAPWNPERFCVPSLLCFSEVCAMRLGTQRMGFRKTDVHMQ